MHVKYRGSVRTRRFPEIANDVFFWDIIKKKASAVSIFQYCNIVSFRSTFQLRARRIELYTTSVQCEKWADLMRESIVGDRLARINATHVNGTLAYSLKPELQFLIVYMRGHCPDAAYLSLHIHSRCVPPSPLL